MCEGHVQSGIRWKFYHATNFHGIIHPFQSTTSPSVKYVLYTFLQRRNGFRQSKSMITCTKGAKLIKLKFLEDPGHRKWAKSNKNLASNFASFYSINFNYYSATHMKHVSENSSPLRHWMDNGTRASWQNRDVNALHTASGGLFGWCGSHPNQKRKNISLKIYHQNIPIAFMKQSYKGTTNYLLFNFYTCIRIQYGNMTIENALWCWDLADHS